MPWWVIIYLCIFILAAIWGIIGNIKEYQKWYLAGDVANDIIVIYLGSSFWLPKLLVYLGAFSHPLLLISFVWLPVGLFMELKNTFPYKGLSKSGNIFMGISVFLIILLLNLPLYYWGFNSVVLNNYSGN